jgi:hypothetical protein
MIVSRRGIVSIGYAFLDEDVEKPDVDIVNYVHRLKPIDRLSWEERHTRLIDLRQDAETLLAGIDSSTRYKIRRAEQRDGVRCTRWDTRSEASLKEFCDAFNTFAREKGQPILDLWRLRPLADAGILEITRAAAADDVPLVWHSYLRVGDRARLLHSCSLHRSADDTGFRNLIGRANRYLHWSDMLLFKKEGFALYDMGGWHLAGTDPELVRINEFKESFGGDVVPCYSSTRPLTVKGRIVSRLRDLARRRRA